METLVAIGSDGLCARINPLGAELSSLTDGAGREWMTDADPAFWTGRAPLLFPIVGELRDGTYRLDGKEYALARHGFARRMAFAPIAHAPDEARFELTDNEATRAVYPFAFALEMRFRVEGMTLAMEAVVRNPGSVPLPFSFGYHPAFAWPLPGGGEKEDHTIVFAHNEPEDVARLDAAGLVARRHPTPVVGDTLALDAALFDDDALIFDALTSRSLEYRGGGANPPSLVIDFPDTPWLALWQKPGAAFLCIEPWHGLADADDFAGAFIERPGVVVLPPGESRSFRMTVTVKPGP